MRWQRALVTAALAASGLLAAPAAPAKSAADSLAPSPESSIPATWHRAARFDYVVAPSGASVDTETWDVRADSTALAHTIAQQSYSAMADSETVELLTAYTRKQDGTVIAVPKNSVMDRGVTTVAAAPQFTAQTVRTILFPRVEAGDTVHYELRRTRFAPLFPGQFLFDIDLGGAEHVDKADITLTLPPGMVVRTASSGLVETPPAVSARHWTLDPAAIGTVALDGSTFSGYEAVGQAYAARAEAAARPSPAISALAEQLAPEGTGERETAERLYQFVSRSIRYVALFLGDGRVVPRPADEVLADGWGDCKDHVALLQALLAAKGIRAVPALISLHPRYDLPDPPGLAVLDHVITYLPSLDLFLDSTSPYAPFGLLPAREYDKPVVIADEQGAYLARTPPVPEPGLVLQTDTEAHIAADGTISGVTATNASGPESIALRVMAGWYEGNGASATASARLQQIGTPGTGRFEFDSPGAIGSDYRVDGRFVLDDKLPLADGAPMIVPRGLDMFGPPGAVLLSSARSEDGGHQCYPGLHAEAIRLDLPDGLTVKHLPPPLAVTGGGASYTATYAIAHGSLVVTRRFSLTTAHQRCSEDEYRAMQPVLAAAQRDARVLIWLSPRDQAMAGAN